jgi:hypothetical protein
MTLKILMLLAVAFVTTIVAKVDGKLYPIAENAQGAPAATKQATRKLGQSLVSEEDFRALMQQRQTAEVCDATCNLFTTYTGSCSGLFEKTDKWCTSTVFGEVCCADSSSDCCKASPGGIVLFVVISLVIVVAITIASCACCSCCPWYPKLCCAPKKQRNTSEPPAPVAHPKATVRMDADNEA